MHGWPSIQPHTLASQFQSTTSQFKVGLHVSLLKRAPSSLERVADEMAKFEIKSLSTHSAVWAAVAQIDLVDKNVSQILSASAPVYSQNVSHSVFTFSQSVGSAPTCRLMLSRKMFCKYFLPPFHIVVLSKCVKFHILWHACCHQPQCTKGSFGRTFLRVTQSRWTQKPKNPVPNLQCV